MVVDSPSGPEQTLTPCPVQKGKMKAVLTPSPAPLPTPAPPTAQPHAPAQAPCAPKPKPQALPHAAASAVPSAPPPTSYAKAMASVPKPKFHTRPSLVVHLHHTSLATPLREVAQSKAPALVVACNEALSSEAQHANIWVSAAKWSPGGNLVVFTGPEMSLTQLQATHHIIVGTVEATLPTPTPLSSHSNVKWSKVLINAVLTGVTDVFFFFFFFGIKVYCPQHSYQTYMRNLHDGPHYRPCYSLLRVLMRLLNPYTAPQKRQIAKTAPADS